MAVYPSIVASLSPGAGVPTGWTDRWSTASLTTSVEAAATPVGNRFIRRTPTLGGARLLSWNMIDGDAARANVDVLMLHRTALASPQQGCAARGASGNSTRDGIVGQAFSVIRIVVFDEGSPVAVVSGSYTHAADEWRWMRLRSNGTSIRVRAWVFGAREPAAWQVDFTDSAVSAAGWVGIYSGDTGNHDTAYFAVGTDGDYAPAPARRRGILAATPW